ncbi:MAG: RagB/SusD family nutrient uptake outer membrane protein, partial [Butyricimonas paravirosa]
MAYKKVLMTWMEPAGLVFFLNSANAAIEAISNLAENKFPTPERKQEMLAEARCMRGWAYTNLFWLFGRWWDADDSAYGILYRDKMSNLSNLQVPRSSVGESYTKIFEDLDDAIANMPDFTTSRSLSRQMAQVLKAKILLYRGAMRGSTQDLKDALTLVETVKRDAPSGWQMESDIAAMYEVGWDSKEVLWARYLGDFASTTSYEFDYSYNIGYNNTYSDIATGWLKEDPRYEVVMDSARAPETWDTKMVFTPVKLYHGGRY